MMNPDESELLATARLAAQPGGLYANYTTSTFGPVWPEFLGFLNHIGMELDHFSAHQLAVVIKFLIFVTPQYLAIKKLGFLRLSPVIILLNISLFLPTSVEFAFLSTELLPLLFLTLAVIVVLYAKNEFACVISGCLFALAFLSKYQSLPMIFILISFIFLRCIKNGVFNYKAFKYNLFKFSISIFATFSIFVALLNFSKTFNVFFIESLMTSIDYSTAGNFGGGANIFDKFKVGSALLIGQPLVVFTLMLFQRIILGETFSKSIIQIRNKKLQLSNITYVIFVFFLLIGFITISFPGNGFPHYLLFFLWTQTIYLLVLETLSIHNNIEHKKYNETRVLLHRKYSGISIVLIVLISSLNSVTPAIKSFLDSSIIIENNNLRLDEVRASQALHLPFCPANSQVLIWGWSSELFIYFDWTPPPYVVNDVARIKVSQLSNYSISRIASAISSENTDCIFIATGPQYFGGLSSLEGFDLLPRETIQILDLEYSKNILANGTLVWSRK